MGCETDVRRNRQFSVAFGTVAITNILILVAVIGFMYTYIYVLQEEISLNGVVLTVAEVSQLLLLSV